MHAKVEQINKKKKIINVKQHLHCNKTCVLQITLIHMIDQKKTKVVRTSMINDKNSDEKDTVMCDPEENNNTRDSEQNNQKEKKRAEEHKDNDMQINADSSNKMSKKK